MFGAGAISCGGSARANPKSAILSTGSIEPLSRVHALDAVIRQLQQQRTYLHAASVGSEHLTITQ